MIYSGLIDAARAYCDRVDVEVNQNVKVFVLMAEARINRTLKVTEQTHRVYTRTMEGKEFYSLPEDFNGMRVVHFNTGDVDAQGSGTIQLHYVTPEQMIEMQESAYSETQTHYTILNNQLQLHKPLPNGGTIEMVMYRKVPPLSENNPSNWMSTDNPDIYLAGISAEIEMFVKNYDAAKLWDDRMTRAIEELKNNDSLNRWTGNTMVMRVG